MALLLWVWFGCTVFVLGCAYRAYRYASAPPHLRWDLYPVAHEKGRAGFVTVGALAEKTLPLADHMANLIIVEAGVEALRSGRTHYTSNYGTIELREALATHLERRYDVRYDPAREMLITVGGSEALAIAMQAVVDPGDEVVLAEPSYVAYVPDVIFSGGRAVYVATRPEDGWQLDPGAVEAAITPRTKALFIGFPNNPTGAVLDPDRMRALAAIAERHDILRQMLIPVHGNNHFFVGTPVPRNKIKNADAGRVLPGLNTRPGRRANGCRIGMIEHHPLTGQFVDIRCLVKPIAIHRQITPSEIICHDDDDVRLLCGNSFWRERQRAPDTPKKRQQRQTTSLRVGLRRKF